MDYYALFKKLNKNKIKYIVAGGLAVNLHGIPRLTYDVDLLVNMEEENLKRLLKLLKSLGFKPKIPVIISDFVNPEKRDNWIKNKNMKAFCLRNEKWAISELDILIDVPVDYKDAISKAVFYRVRDIDVPTVSINDLIKMKKNTGRLQDESDIKHLKRLK
ncbi:MAG: hypothetical protein Q7K21_07990 [Elusimicrobiota bacterium]|nr:hypothetical protein [Elusimicrobiota bacterium]